MVTLHSCAVSLAALLLLSGCAQPGRPLAPPASAEQRAIAYLVREVPAWSRDNGCFSCHNNGDAARGLYAAKRAGFTVPAAALADTTGWVQQPARWEHNQGDPGFSDQRLANLQFAMSLAAAVATGLTHDRGAVTTAAAKVATDQGLDGTWRIEAQDALGSPATYGTTLATFSAWQVLRQSDSAEAHAAAAKAAAWLRQAPLNNVPAAAMLLRFSLQDASPTSVPRQVATLAFLQRAQTSDDGWGPYPDAPAEVFDTALALLALAELPPNAATETMRQRGRTFLLTQQRPDGSWAATTRPSGGESYAQHMSTTGWALQALLASQRK